MRIPALKEPPSGVHRKERAQVGDHRTPGYKPARKPYQPCADGSQERLYVESDVVQAQMSAEILVPVLEIFPFAPVIDVEAQALQVIPVIRVDAHPHGQPQGIERHDERRPLRQSLFVKDGQRVTDVPTRIDGVAWTALERLMDLQADQRQEHESVKEPLPARPPPPGNVPESVRDRHGSRSPRHSRIPSALAECTFSSPPGTGTTGDRGGRSREPEARATASAPARSGDGDRPACRRATGPERGRRRTSV